MTGKRFLIGEHEVCMSEELCQVSTRLSCSGQGLRTHMYEACCNNGSDAELFDDYEHDPRRVRLQQPPQHHWYIDGY